MWLVRGLCLALALAGLASLAGAALALALAPFVRRLAATFAARTRADLLFALRLAPTGLALTLTALFVPAYALLEPAHADERIGVPLLALVALAVGVVAAGLARGVSAFRATARLEREWRRAARAVAVPGWPGAASRIEAEFPVVAVAGIVRPRLYVAGRVLERLPEDELQAVLAHERAHVESRDNLRSLIVRGCLDPLALVPAGRRLEADWRRACELAADERLLAERSGGALALASALVGVARLVPTGARLAASCHAVPALLAWGDVPALAERVACLLEQGGRRLPRRGLLPGLATAVGLALAIGLEPGRLELVHAFAEALLARLS